MTLHYVRVQILVHLHLILLGEESLFIFLWDPYETNEKSATFLEHVKRLVDFLLFLYEVLVDKDQRNIFLTFQWIVLSQIFDKGHLALGNELSD